MKKLLSLNENLVKGTLCPYAFGLILTQIIFQIIGTEWLPKTKFLLFLLLFAGPFAIGLSLRDQVNNAFDKYGTISLIGGINLIWLGLDLSKVDSALSLGIFFLTIGTLLLFNSCKGLTMLYKKLTQEED